MRRLPLLTTLVLTALLPGCRDLLTIEATGRCGDGVLELERGEDCDTHALGEGTACGPPGSEQACRYTCADTPCPADWQCGTDGICRAPSTRFLAAGSLTVDAERLTPGDVDGDGLVDLVIIDSTAITTAFGDREGRFARVVTVPASVHQGEAAVGDIDGDGRADVTVPSLTGVSVYLGQSVRRLTPLPFPIEVFTELHGQIRAAHLGHPPGEAPRSLVFAGDGDGLRAVVTGVVTGAASESDALDDALAGLSGAPTLVELPGAGDPVFALAPVGAARGVFVAPVCGAGGCALEVAGQFSAPVGQSFSALDPVAADLDGDGALDLLVNLGGGPSGALAIARGQGDGGFGALVREPWPVPPRPGCLGCEHVGVIAAGDAVGDALVDFVGPGGVFRTLGLDPLRLEALPLDLRGHLRAARYVDFNLDGRLDIAAVRRGDQVDLLVNDGERFLVHGADVDGLAERLVVGDFDGDLHPDLAVLEAGTRLAVLFADGLGLPRDRVLMSEGSRIEEIALRPGQGSEPDGLWLYARTATAGELVVIPFSGASTRRMDAPIYFPASMHAAAAVRLGEERALVAIGRAMGWRLFVAQLGEPIGARVPAVSEMAVDCLPDVNVELSLAAADLDGDGRDEVIVTGRPGPQLMGMRTLWPVFVLRLDAAASCRAYEVPAVGAAPAGPVVVDLDGDGALDLLVALPATLGADRTQGAGFAVFWGDGAGGFAATPTVEAASAVVTPLRFGRDGPTRLAYVADGRLHLAGFDSARTFNTDAGGIAIGATAETVTAVHALDADGDGLDDLLVVARDLLLFRQQPCDAARAAVGQCARSEP